jgi:hypothetical protein
MPSRFERSGIRFQYPTDWQLETVQNDAGWTANLQTPGVGFMFITLDTASDYPGDLVDISKDAMEEEYPNAESTTVVDNHLQRPVFGYDLEFFTLDMLNWCAIRSLTAPEGALLVFAQCPDLERASFEQHFQKVWKSLEYDETE